MARRVQSQSQSFGQLAVEAGVLKDEQLIDVKKVQEDAERAGEPVPHLDDLVASKGYMTADEVRLIKRAAERIRRDERREKPVRLGGYEILGKLGDGGLGTVYKARQISMGRIIALKVLHKKWMQDEEFKKRFLLEARLAGRMSHQNLIQVYDVGREKDTYHFSMEFVDGETIEQIVDRDGPMPLDRALEVAIQVVRAITYIWKFKIVHRDIKPGNIMLTRSGTAKLADFGFVKSKFDPLLSTEGEVLGTPDYISPEQALGLADIDFRSDIYSLGCSLYHMLTGRPPFGGTSSEIMRKHIKEDLPPAREAAPDLPEAACELLAKMMSKDPEERYENTQQLFEDIELIRMGQVRGAEGPTAGKATILRAFNIEKGRLERMQADIKLLHERLRRTRMIMYAAIAIAGVLSSALLIALAKL